MCELKSIMFSGQQMHENLFRKITMFLQVRISIMKFKNLEIKRPNSQDHVINVCHWAVVNLMMFLLTLN